jgi:hypothetical protein
VGRIRSPRYFKPINSCKKDDLVSFANIVAWPNKKSPDLINVLTKPKDNHIIDLYFFQSNSLIGGYIAKYIPSYQVILLKELEIIPHLSSKIYGREMVENLGKIGLNAFDENFKGIVATTECTETKKSIDYSNKYKIRSLINAGGEIVVECIKHDDKIYHLIFVPYNGGLNKTEVEEIFNKILFSPL